MFATPQDEHRWLEQLIGRWSFVATCAMGPGQPPAVTRGREIVRALGPFWVLVEGEGEMPGGGAMKTLVQIGFDPALGRFRGTWIGSMMPMLWVYDGSLDAARKVLTLTARGPSMTGDGSITDYEDILDLSDPDRRRFRSRARLADGSWNEFLSIAYTRQP